MHIGLLSRPFDCLRKVEDAGHAVNNLAKNEIHNAREGFFDIGVKVKDLVDAAEHVNLESLDIPQVGGDIGGAVTTGTGVRRR